MSAFALHCVRYPKLSGRGFELWDRAVDLLEYGLSDYPRNEIRADIRTLIALIRKTYGKKAKVDAELSLLWALHPNPELAIQQAKRFYNRSMK